MGGLWVGPWLQVRSLRIPVILLAAVLSLLWLTPPPLWAAGAGSNITAVHSKSLPYDQWYQTDRAHMAVLLKTYKGNSRALTKHLVKEWYEISAELGKALGECYREPVRQYLVYDAPTSGKIHVLSLARYYREKVLSDLLAGTYPTRQYPDLWSNNPAGIPSSVSNGFSPASRPPDFGVKDVAAVVNDFDLPPAALRGLSFFILPFNLTGYAATSHTRYLPGVEESIYLSASINKESPPLAVTIAHELGHYIHYQYNGSYEQDPVKWGSFMNLIGEDEFRGSSAPFRDNTEEQFAEYFRMVYGSAAGRSMRFRTSAPNPLYRPDLFDGFKRIVDGLVSQSLPSYYDVNNMWISGVDDRGQQFSLPVGVRSELINTIVTTSPQLRFSSSVILNPKDPFNPLVTCFRFDPRAVLVDYSTPKVEQDYINCSINLPKPGIYTLFVGETDGSRNILNSMSFKIIYTGNI